MATAKRTRLVTVRSGASVRDRILDAAIAALRESGLQRFTQMLVAERAGVRQSHLTYYFPTRDDLFAAVTTRAVSEIAGAVRRAVAEEDIDHAAALDRLASSIGDRAHMRMFVGMTVEADGDPGLRAILVAGTRRLESELAHALGGAEARQRARLVLAALWGLGLYRFLVRPARKSEITRPYVRWLVEASHAPRTPKRRRARAR